MQGFDALGNELEHDGRCIVAAAALRAQLPCTRVACPVKPRVAINNNTFSPPKFFRAHVEGGR